MEIPPRLQPEISDADPHTSMTWSPAPLVRVVIPAFRATETIKDAVVAVLQSRGFFDLEVVVVDDGDNDDLQGILSGMPVAIVGTGGSGSAAIARNTGVDGFPGKFIVFVDSDVLVDERCIEYLLAPLRSLRADATVGNYSKNVAGLPFASRYKQLYISRIYERRSGYLLNEFWTATGAVNAAAFHRLNGFDSRFTGAGGEDTELGGRLTTNGFRIMAVPEAVSDHRHAFSLWQLLRNDWRKGLLAMRCYFQRAGTLSHNRHATRRDILAVGLADLTAVLLVLSPVVYRFIGLEQSLALVSVLSIYGALRADILRAFLSQGTWFVIRAFGVMFLLDLTRSACFAAGIGLWLTAHVAKSAEIRDSLAGIE
jgi:glycosyltransferase involved in cell wall biosynthesis